MMIISVEILKAGHFCTSMNWISSKAIPVLRPEWRN